MIDDINIGTIRESDTTESVKADANARCFTCRGEGWHWGWRANQPVMLRCPCVDRNRASPHMRDHEVAE